jgi:hypothetical protein
MKKITYIVLMLSCTSALFSQTRNTLWLRGIGPASTSWLQTKTILSSEGYDFKDLHTVGNGGNYDPLLGVVGAADLLDANITQENVLGIAHDYGGIILRDLQLQNGNISAMILDGVPNQGSSIVEYTSNVANNAKSTAEHMLDDVLDFRAESECDEDCGYISNFQEFLQDLKANGQNLLDVSPDGAALNNLTDPTVPFVILYGTIEENSIVELMNSQADQLGAGEDFYKTCYLANLRKAQKEAKDEFVKSTLTNVIGFAKGFIDNISAVITGLGGPLSTLIGAATDLFNSTKDDVTAQIEELAKRDEALARLAKCELSHQLLQAQWEIQLMQNSNLTYVSTTGPDTEYCKQFCEDMGVEDGLNMMLCLHECEQNNTITTTTLVVEENDGVLTKSEQLLDGAVQTYHLEDTDHIKETSMFSGGLDEHLHEIFDGGVGAEFVIPK